MIKKILTHSLLYAIGPQVPRVVGIFILPLLTAYLTPTDYGIAGVVASYVGIVSGLKDLGASFLLVNYYYTKPLYWRLLWRKLHGFLFVWSIPFGVIICVVLAMALGKNVSGNQLFWISAMMVTQAIFFDTPSAFGGRFFQFEQKPGQIALISMITGLAVIFTNVITIAYLKMGFMGWFISTFVGSFISFLFYGYHIYIKEKILPVIRISKKYISSTLSLSLPTIPHNYSAYLLNSSDRFILDRFHVGLDKIGVYNLAYTFGNYMDVVGSAMGMAVGPYYNQFYSSGRNGQRIKYFTFLLQVLFLLGPFVVAIWLKEVISILISNEALKLIYPFAIVLVMSYAYRPMYWSNINLLLFHKRTKSLWKISFVAGVLNVALNLMFVPLWGIWAATINTFICNICLGYSGYFLKDVKVLGRTGFKDMWWLIVTVALTGAAYFVKDQILLVKLSVTLIAIFAALPFLFVFYRKLAALEKSNI